MAPPRELRSLPQAAAAAASRNDLGKDGWSAIFKALSENNGGKIESWDLTNEGIGPETAKVLAEYIQVSSALKTLKCAAQPNAF